MFALRAPSAVALAMLSGVAGWGCRVFDESLLDAGADGGVVDAGPGDAGTDAQMHDAGCSPIRPPGRPPAEDGDGEELMFALKDLVLDQRPERWRSIGYDLDGLCSEPPEPEVECRPPDETAPPETDGERGTDNAFGHRVPLLLFAFVGDVNTRLAAVHEQGRGLVLLRLGEWNGEDDDPRVDVILSHSVRAELGEAADAGVPDGGVVPRWDGTDVFYGSTADFVGGDPARPRTRNDNAYVSGRTLVVPLPERAPLVWEGEDLALSVVLTDAVLTARISDDASRLEDVTLSGRWSVLDVLEAFEGLGFCAGDENQMALDRLLNEAADVRETEALPDVPCDALSVGIALTGYLGTWGGIETPSPAPAPCD